MARSPPSRGCVYPELQSTESPTRRQMLRAIWPQDRYIALLESGSDQSRRWGSMSPPHMPQLPGLVSVIIPTHNGFEMLSECIQSLGQQTYANIEIIVVDNGSKDSTPTKLQAKYPNVSLVRHEKNLGFAKAINSGISAAKGKYVLLLNDDTRAKEDAIRVLVEAI